MGIRYQHGREIELSCSDLGDEVARQIAEKTKPEFRKALCQRLHRLDQRAVGQGVRNTNAKRTRRLRILCSQSLEIVDALQHIAALFHDPDAQLRQPRRLDGSVEQLGVEFSLEPLYLARYGGGRAMQAVCRARDRSGFGKFNQGMNVFEHGDHPGPCGTAIGRLYRNRNIIVTIMNLMNVTRVLMLISKHAGQAGLIRVLAE